MIQKKKTRNSNLELLRIVCMLLIVSLHYYEYGFYMDEVDTGSINYLILRFFGFGGHMAVDIFVMISGYFMVNQNMSGKKVIKLWLQVSAAAALGFLLSKEFSFSSLYRTVFAITDPVYWFATTYLLLYLLSGFVNKLIHSMNRHEHFLLIFIMLTITSILPTFLGIRMESSQIFLFVLMYLIGAYIRLYSPRVFESKYCLIIGFGFHWLCYLFSAVMVCMSGRIPILMRLADRMNTTNDITIIIAAVFIFAGFKNLRLKNSRLLNEIAASAFGVYLIHNTTYFLHALYVDLFRSPEFIHSKWLILHVPATVAGIYTICTVIDLFYRHVIEKQLMKFVDKHWDTWHAAAAKIAERALSIVK